MNESLRWDPYVLRRDEGVDALWRDLMTGGARDVLYVLGLGFDPRMCDGFERVLAAGGEGRRDVVQISYGAPDADARAELLARRADNDARLGGLLAPIGGRRFERQIPAQQVGRRTDARAIMNVLSADLLGDYHHVVVDVSALPRGLYLPLLAGLLDRHDRAQPPPAWHLHAVVSHAPALDARIVADGLAESAHWLPGFHGARFEEDATEDVPRVWIPVLGRNQLEQLPLASVLVRPDEICPLLPSPAVNPREADDLLVDYREVLFDQMRVEPRNILYASESNPFEVYRQIVRSVRQYHKALRPLEGCKVALSAMSSKLSSLGVLLAAQQFKGAGEGGVAVGVAHVEPLGYRILDDRPAPPPTLFHLWLAGDS